MTTMSDTTETTQTTTTQQAPLNVTAAVAFQLIVENTHSAAAFYQKLFGARVFTTGILPGVANTSDNLITEVATTGTEEALATRTIVIGNTAINLVSKQNISDALGVPCNETGETTNTLPVVITVNVDNVATFVERATEFNAELVQDITTTTEGTQTAFIRGQEGYLWCLTNTSAINTAAGVPHTVA